MKKNSFLSSKKGMSPLIATVLLIAFAVALGAMIMNWSATVVSSESEVDCSKVALAPEILCYADNLIKMKIRNVGVPVEEISVRVSDELAVSDINLKNSGLKKSDILEREVPASRNGETTVGLVPSIDSYGKTTSCKEPVLQRELVDCRN
jgi:flagellin-like protein